MEKAGKIMARAKTKSKARKYTPSDIIDMFDKKRSTTAFADLIDQMEFDFNLAALSKYEPEPGHLSYTTPKPKNDFQKVLNGVNKATLTWQIVTPGDAPQTQRDQASKGEELLTGVIDRADRRLRAVGEPPLRSSLSWFGCGRGIAALKCLIYTNDERDTEIDIRPLDPMHMAWERGVNGLVWVAYEYHIGKEEALERFGIELGDEDDGRVIDFFDRTINAVVLSYGGASKLKESQFVKDPTAHGLKGPPVWIGFVGSMPTVFTKDNGATLQHRASSVFASSRNIYEPFNKQVSFIMDVAEKSVAGTLVYESKEGKKTVKGDPFANWQVIAIAEGEKITPLMPPKVPVESTAILAIIDRDKQESTVPYPIGYGIDTASHSGAALSIMNDSTKSIYDPFCALVADGYRWLCEEILTQFKTKGQKLNLQGFDVNGKFFVLDATPDDIQDDWYIQVTCEPKLPRDEAGELQMALAATNPRAPSGRPFLDDYTALEKIVKIQNPDAVIKRIDEQMTLRMIEQMPNYQIRKVAKALIDKGEVEAAQELLASIPAPPGAGGGQPGPGQGAPPQGAPQGQPGAQGQPLTPEELQKLAAIAAQMQAQGQPVPQEIQAALAMSQQQPGGQIPPI